MNLEKGESNVNPFTYGRLEAAYGWMHQMDFGLPKPASKHKLASANQKEIAMNPILALTTLDETRARKNEHQAPRQASGSSTSASLIVVMIVYVLFGFVGFYLAAQVTML